MSDPIRAFVARVNARAEAEMLNGRPVTGAHHRAIEAELAALPDEGAMSDDSRPEQDWPNPEDGPCECGEKSAPLAPGAVCRRCHRWTVALVAAGPVPAPPEREHSALAAVASESADA